MLSASIKTIFLSRCLQGTGQPNRPNMVPTVPSSMDPAQGIGSSFGTVSGLGMIGSFHQDEEKKIEQMGKAMSGLAIGVLLGPPLRSGYKLYRMTHTVWASDHQVMPLGADTVAPLPLKKFNLHKYRWHPWSLSVYVSFQCTTIWNCLLCKIKTSIWNFIPYIDYISSPGKERIPCITSSQWPDSEWSRWGVLLWHK